MPAFEKARALGKGRERRPGGSRDKEGSASRKARGSQAEGAPLGGAFKAERIGKEKGPPVYGPGAAAGGSRRRSKWYLPGFGPIE
jgi:hypothetical protein